MKTKNTTKLAVPVTQEPFPEALRSEIHHLVRGGAEIKRVDDLGDSIYRIEYVHREVRSTLVDLDTPTTATAGSAIEAGLAMAGAL